MGMTTIINTTKSRKGSYIWYRCDECKSTDRQTKSAFDSKKNHFCSRLCHRNFRAKLPVSSGKTLHVTSCGVVTNYLMANAPKFKLQEWLKKKHNYPYCKCGRRYVRTYKYQRRCLFCSRGKV